MRVQYLEFVHNKGRFNIRKHLLISYGVWSRSEMWRDLDYSHELFINVYLNKVKIMLSVSTPWRYILVVVKLHTFLTSALDKRTRLTSFPATNEPQYPLNRLLCGLQARSGSLYWRAKYCTCDRITASCVAHRFMLEYCAIRRSKPYWTCITTCEGESQRVWKQGEILPHRHLQATCENL